MIHFQADRKFPFDPPQNCSNRITSEFANSLSIAWSWIVRNFTFDPPFRTVWKRIKSGFSNKFSHVIINFEEKFGWIKSESACICFTWLPPSDTLPGQKLDGPTLTTAYQNYKIDFSALRIYPLFHPISIMRIDIKHILI